MKKESANKIQIKFCVCAYMTSNLNGFDTWCMRREQNMIVLLVPETSNINDVVVVVGTNNQRRHTL